MTTKPSDNDPGDAAARDDRKQRLAAALRENLKRRKAQARGRTSAEPDDSPAGDSEKSSHGSPPGRR